VPLFHRCGRKAANIYLLFRALSARMWRALYHSSLSLCLSPGRLDIRAATCCAHAVLLSFRLRYFSSCGVWHLFDALTPPYALLAAGWCGVAAAQHRRSSERRVGHRFGVPGWWRALRRRSRAGICSSAADAAHRITRFEHLTPTPSIPLYTGHFPHVTTGRLARTLTRNVGSGRMASCGA